MVALRLRYDRGATVGSATARPPHLTLPLPRDTLKWSPQHLPSCLLVGPALLPPGAVVPDENSAKTSRAYATSVRPNPACSRASSCPPVGGPAVTTILHPTSLAEASAALLADEDARALGGG